jgi:hypothetical protein
MARSTKKKIALALFVGVCVYYTWIDPRVLTAPVTAELMVDRSWGAFNSINVKRTFRKGALVYNSTESSAPGVCIAEMLLTRRAISRSGSLENVISSTSPAIWSAGDSQRVRRVRRASALPTLISVATINRENRIRPGQASGDP